MEFENKKESNISFEEAMQGLRVNSFKNKKEINTQTSLHKTIHTSTISKYTNTPVNRQVKKKKINYNNSKFNPDFKLDLHGFTVVQSELVIRTILTKQCVEKWHTMVIITGKGEGILRNFTRSFLDHLGTEYHFIRRDAPQHLGADGAWLLLFN